MHSFVNRIFRSEIHLPSAPKLWQIPALEEFPIPLPSPLLSTPLEEQETSYLAASARMFSFSLILIFSCSFIIQGTFSCVMISISQPAVLVPPTAISAGSCFILLWLLKKNQNFCSDSILSQHMVFYKQLHEHLFYFLQTQPPTIVVTLLCRISLKIPHRTR